MIYTLTFNPSLDYVIDVPQYKEGAVNRTAAEKYLPGGKGINVSVVLNNIGCDTKALGFAAGFTGTEIERLLSEQGVAADFVHLKSGASRINIKIKAQAETEINAKGPTVDELSMEAMYRKLDDMCDGDYLVLAGSVPGGIGEDIYYDIMKKLSSKNVNIAVDAEKQLLMNTLSCSPFLIKPNHHELGDIFGIELTDPKEAAVYGRKLQNMGARNVLVSMSRKGGVLISESGDAYYCPAPDGVAVNSTGAGDSTVAGFIAAYAGHGDCKAAFAYAMCSGAASAFSKNLATKQEIEALYHNQNMLAKVQPIG
ncbi:MAG: 1-phosphofructokinase [Clostridia bacterium]|nr:1-phosphofructokinase [Clostridia bacterium]